MAEAYSRKTLRAYGAGELATTVNLGEIEWAGTTLGDYIIIGQHRLVCDCGRHLPCRHCEDDD